ncbi:MAG TPA: hypothetical protein V6D23_25745 [Candidatus Obscuribacterales bacterium]
MTHAKWQKRFLGIAGLWLVIGGLSGPAIAVRAAEWRSETATEHLSVLPKGKGLLTSVSPFNPKHRLIIRDEADHGDFFYLAYYFFDGKHYTLLGSYVSTGKMPAVSWKRDALSFLAKIPTGPDTVQVLQVEYSPTLNQLRSKVLKTETMEHPG